MLYILFCLLPSILIIAAFIRRDIKKHRYYQGFYKTLPFKTFFRNNDFVYSHNSYQKNDGFYWYIERNTFQFGDNYYLSDVSWDPVSKYWLYKFTRWFKENIRLDFLQEYSIPHINSSNIKAEHEFSSSYAYDAYLRRYFAGVTLCALSEKEELNEALVRNVIEVANKLVAELRFKEKKANSKNYK